ncbi:hypothetical protein CkaCkLH20_06931 [Colletotrichum karsti]|uniref:Heme haloperoxidase family profile domain-containing protein n=1 Tax=Colletotrichum karsti TaxID=1095194 RepID=A0A9P6LK20_9PEZI|nr:uncharacterized protein CkaCkLH20_06931 [Colletotrichum karsti]KAF9875550.1 hypothetical protein CkaCkLH20_06931 [Colletotrichum karsti]
MQISSLLVMGLAPIAYGFPHFANTGVGHSFRPPTSKAGNDTNRLKPQHFMWKPPGPNDLRSPCPVMNTMANHGFVPRDGRNMTREILIKGLGDGLNIAEVRAINIFENALQVNPIPNATFFDFQMMHTHNIIEHDGSLSRRDAVFDPTNSFDKGTFDNFVSYFGDEQAINISMIANARARHALDMSRINPTFNITQAQIPVIVGENAMLLVIFGRPDNPIANRSFLEYFFRNERLPVELGWVPPDVAIDATVGPIVQDIIAQSPPDVPLTFTPQTSAWIETRQWRQSEPWHMAILDVLDILDILDILEIEDYPEAFPKIGSMGDELQRGLQPRDHGPTPFFSDYHSLQTGCKR